ncbi:MAG: Hpt domain-containing protein [Sideroxydans sp.]|nr:Hpt domain-containing protein [Sideroxydans sp.]
MTPEFNPLLLSSVKSELDSSLATIIRELEQFFSTGGKHPLDAALAELHRLRGVLQMLQLHGLVVFCGELETLIQELSEHPENATVMHQDALRHALFGLTHYLDALSAGAANAALRLFPEYQELHQVRGLDIAFEVDLFFPALNVDLPPEILAGALPDNPPARIKQARMHFQQALLKWLRRDEADDALRAMTAAVKAVADCVTGDERGFWWVAQGLLSCILLEGVPPELNVKKSFSRIDQGMRALLDDSEFDKVGAISEMLYLVARSHTVDETVEQIKRVFDLDNYLPEAPPLPPGETLELLEKMRSQLNAADEAWEQCVLNDRESCTSFAAISEQLHAMSEQLDRNTLQFLCKQIHTTAQHVENPEHAQIISMDMAMALLLLDSGIDHYQHLGSGFHEQARLLTSRLHESLLKQPEDQSKLASLVALYCEMEQRDVMGLLATEMQNNLQQIEQTLNAFFGNAAKRAELLQVNRLLSQVQGGLHILSLDLAEHLLISLRQITERYHQGDTPSAAEMRAVATSISVMDDYVHGLSLGQKPDPMSLNDVMRDLAEATAGHAQALTVSAEEEASAAVVSIRSGDEDAELLEVFLEEAQEVMETLRANLEISRLHLDSREPWVTMRRAFHTLKGSGRMVGLTELGEIAWAVERAMNKWLASDQPATPELLDLVGDAEVLFQHWIDMLKSGSTTAQIDTSSLLTLADCIEHDKPVPQPVTPEIEDVAEPEAVPAAPAEAEPEPEPEEERPIIIGNVSMSPMLFNIASEEALEHVKSLRTCFDSVQESSKPVVGYDFMRAAHTLAGVNRTMGFLPIAELAYTLEMWLEPRIDKAGAVGTPQLVLLDDVITRLDELCHGVRERNSPSDQTELIARLQADKVSGGSEVPQEPEQAASEEVLDFAAAPEAVAPEPQISPPEVELEAQEPEQAASEEALKIAAAHEAVTPESQISTPEVALETETEVALEAQEEHTTPVRVVQHQRTVHDEVDEQLLPIFLEEAHELYPQIGSTLRAWREKPSDAQQGRNLQRSLHTLKGSARMAGAMRLGELTHRVEDRVGKAIAQNALDESLWNEMDNYLDRIAHAIEQLTQPPPFEPTPAAAEQTESASTTAPATPAPSAALDIGAERAMQSALLRVRSDVVDKLVNEAGEVSVARSRAEAELREFRTSVLELTDSVNRLRKQLREIEIQAEGQMQARVSVSGEVEQQFDPLEFDRFTRFQELTRFMNESVHDVQTIQQSLLKNLDETSAALNAQAQLNRDLQQGLMGIRMVPFGSITERLYRIVRQTGKELDKRTNLELSGTEIELDRSVLEKMTAPFEHLLRNAIAHGMETPEQRTANGKPAIGEIRFSLRQESNEVVFDLADDGKGLDLARIRQKSLDSGLITADENISDEQLMQLIFTAGLSTAGEVTEIAGRGVGLDVVRSEISALGGRVDVASTPGRGAHFTIHLPLTLAVTRTLMVRAAQSVYALPSTMVEHVQQLKPGELSALYEQQYVDWQGRRYPLFYLPRVLGDDQAEIATQPHNPVLLLRSGEQRIALHVDGLLGNQEVVVKNIGPQLARLPGIAGATVSGDGRVILIINPVAFTQRIAVTRKIAKKVVTEAVHTKPLVMVVDDSLTVRKITTRLLERNGYLTVTAKDGVDALEQLMEISPDVMLLDIEMPRMDGFELAKRLRQDSKTRALPVIMITSRTADKHRNYALELGVNEYLGKPFQEEELLGHIARLTGS